MAARTKKEKTKQRKKLRPKRYVRHGMPAVTVCGGQMAVVSVTRYSPKLKLHRDALPVTAVHGAASAGSDLGVAVPAYVLYGLNILT